MKPGTGTGHAAAVARGAANSLVRVARLRYDGAGAGCGHHIGVRKIVVSGEHRLGITDHSTGVRGPKPRAITPIRGCQV